MMKHTIITIGRQFGSGGHEVGNRLAERLDIPLYDHNLIRMAAQELRISSEDATQVDETILGRFLTAYIVSTGNYTAFMSGDESGEPLSDLVFNRQSAIIRKLAEKGPGIFVYVEPFFNEIRLGEPVEKVMNEIARCMEEAGNVPFLHSGINPMDYDSVKEHLAVMLVNTQANKRMLQEMPHENMEDLSAICYVDFPVESNDGKATMKVKNEHLKMWNVDAKEMFQQARANTQPVNTPILQSMDEMMLSIFNEEGHATNLLDENIDFGFRSHDMLYALTNVEKQYGASMITQPEVLNKLEQLFPEGFYVLPSSVHEVLIVPDNGEMEPKMLGEMVREVNKNEVERQEVLSDRVYSYDKEKHQIRQEPDSIQKVKEMER